MLTSLSEDVLDEIGMRGPIASQVERLALLAKEAGLDGVVASPQEIALIRARLRRGLRHRHAGHPRRRRAGRCRRGRTISRAR